MSPFLRYRIFYSVLSLLVLVGLWTAWNVQHSWREAQASRLRLDQKKTEFAHLLAAGKSAGAGLEDSNVAELDHLRAQVRRRQAEFNIRRNAGLSTGDRTVPDNATDAFFDLAVFSEQMRSLARQEGVELKADERFGFADYEGTGPANASVPAVHHQRVLAAYLLENLFAAGPHELVGVEREGVEAGRSDAGAAGRGVAGRRPDYFELERRLTARVPGLIKTTAFRVRFTGMTGTLRAFLNALANSGVPNAIRSVDVAPQNQGASGRAAGGTPRGDRALVVPGDLLFKVTVEFFTLAEPVQPADRR